MDCCAVQKNSQPVTSVLKGDVTSQSEQQDCLLHRQLEKCLRENPSLGPRQALVFPKFDGSSISITFAELNVKAEKLAAKISRIIQKTGRNFSNENSDAIVAVCLRHSIELVIGLLAILKAGAAYLPIDPDFPMDRVTLIIKNARPKMLLSSENILENFRAASLSEIPLLDASEIHDTSFHGEVIEKAARPRNSPLAVVLYTSGSSGVPKGVKIEHRTILHRLQWQWRHYPCAKFDETEQPAEMGCFKTALTFVDAIPEIWGTLLNGQTLLIAPRMIVQDTQKFVELLEINKKLRRIFVVPSQLKAILEYLKAVDAVEQLHHIRMWICSGEPLTPQLVHKFYDYFPPGTLMCNYYGSTEVTGDVTAAVFHSREHFVSNLIGNNVPLGKPLDDCAIYLLKSNYMLPSNNLQLVAPGCIGEIYVAGSHVTAGYINFSESPDRFIPNTIDGRNGYETLYRTGDFGKIVNGQLYFEGRSDSQIKVRGHRVDLNEIQFALSQMTQYVTSSAVLCFRAREPQQAILAFVVARLNGCIEIIYRNLRKKLPGYMMPKIVEVEQFPLLVNGKIDRQKLLAFYDQQYLNGCEVQEGKQLEGITLSREEKVLLDTTTSVVGCGKRRSISISDNFFEIGGNSLNAVTVVVRLRDQGFNLDVGTFLAANSLKELVTQMASVVETPIITASEIKNLKQLNSEDFSIETLSNSTKEEVIRIVCKSFSMEDNPCLPMASKVSYDDYEKLLNIIWDDLMEANLSFLVKEVKSERVVAVSLNFDAAKQPVISRQEIGKALSYVVDYLGSIEDPVKQKLLSMTNTSNRTGFLMHGYMMATIPEKSNPAKSILLMHKMEIELLNLAREKGYSAIFTTNSNELTRQICTELLGYRAESSCRIKDFKAPDGTRPFIEAPECWKAEVSSIFL